ncbi:hypothetical protein QE392_001383 [Microbacterium proteolyticum]|uniref:hypothetical protein n=1 Tax=Microbacterium proteolyticum TaxID=1572644 RepID=UPI0027800076|nr:hypothetical protein [Microbacterium proteolyticum]MDQ1169579.1 hypothetical protein [Microbacterium proteolyticum]
MTGPVRVSPSDRTWELIRSFTSPGRYLVAVVRDTSNGHIRNIAMETFETWPEVQA